MSTLARHFPLEVTVFRCFLLFSAESSGSGYVLGALKSSKVSIPVILSRFSLFCHFLSLSVTFVHFRTVYEYLRNLLFSQKCTFPSLSWIPSKGDFPTKGRSIFWSEISCKRRRFLSGYRIPAFEVPGPSGSMTSHSDDSKAQSPTTLTRTVTVLEDRDTVTEKWKFRNSAASFRRTLKTCNVCTLCVHTVCPC